ncbi:30S ribosomal protein S16, partial [Mycobacterium avium subsp. silvaticum ATCC 49884]
MKIKLTRLGKIRNPQYRIAVADARTRRDGRSIEIIGRYHPKEDPSLIEINSERAQYWLSVGAQPTEPVLKLLKITGDWQKFKGLPGAEGRLKVAPPKPSKLELFNAALAEAEGGPTTEAAKPKKKAATSGAKKAARPPSRKPPRRKQPSLRPPRRPR